MKFYIADGINTNELVLSVPSYYTNVERQAVLDASEIAGLKCLRIINESTAIGLSYGFFRKMELDEKIARTVAFVDYGHSKLTVTLTQFTKNKMKVLFHDSDRNLGARNLDYILADLLGEEFNKKYGCDPRKTPRTRLRLLDGIERARKILSANTESTVHLESLMED
jgi:heat shock protein 4